MHRYALLLLATLGIGAAAVQSLPSFNRSDAGKSLKISSRGFGYAYGVGGAVDVRDYGAVCDGTTDDLSAFNSAIAAVASSNVTLHVPSDACYLSSTLVVSKPVHLTGGAPDYTNGTTLIVKNGYDGVKIATGGAGSVIENMVVEPKSGTVAWQANQTNYVAGASTVIASPYNGFVYRAISGTHSGTSQPTWPTTEGATVLDNAGSPSSPVTWEAHYVAGVKFLGRAVVRNVLSTGFPGDGFSVFASVGDGTNANGFGIYTSVSSGNAGWGFYTVGSDSNGGVLENNTALSNGLGGYKEDSFLGNTYIGNVAEGNTTYGYYLGTGAVNNRSTYVGNYSESGQANSISGKGVWVGGIQPDGVYGSGVILRNDWSNTIYLRDDTTDNGLGNSAYLRLGRIGSQDMMELGYSQDSSSTKPFLFKYGEVNGTAQTGWVGWQYYGSSILSPWAMSMDIAAEGGGKVWFPGGFLAGGTDYNVATTWGDGPPVSGTHKKGEMVWARAHNNGDTGWLCTVAGTPGTWVAFYFTSPNEHAYQDGAYGTTGAAGSTGGSATQLTQSTTHWNITGASGTNGVKLPTGPTGTCQQLANINQSGNDMKVYPHTGGTVNGGATDAAFTHREQRSLKYCLTNDTTNWLAY
jgi:hypothetical protein